MTDQRKRPRNRSRSRATGGQTTPDLAAETTTSAIGGRANTIQPNVLPMPNWKWKTFPVYFALSAGLMLGVYMGWIAGFVAADRDNQTPTQITFIIAALLFGFALSRLSTRWMLSRRWIKPRARKSA